MKTVYGIIPARKGSVGVKGKNKRVIAGRALIEFTFEAAQNSNLDQVFLSTNDEEIIELAKKFPKIKIPFKRSEELSQSQTEMRDVAEDLLQWIAKSNTPTPDGICVLQPTSPLRFSKDINECTAIFRAKDIDSVISVREVGNMNPFKMKKIENGFLTNVMTANYSTNRQSLPKCYIPNGAIFLTNTNSLRTNRSFFGVNCIPYEMDEEHSVNIDTELDMKIAEMLLLDHQKRS